MKANAPEKIYLERGYPDNGVLHNGLNYTPKPTDIEYTRTDAFIEKAAVWIKNKAENYIVNTPLCCYFDYKRAVEDFRNYMKGE